MFFCHENTLGYIHIYRIYIDLNSRDNEPKRKKFDYIAL